jgi:hypothetical protein
MWLQGCGGCGTCTAWLQGIQARAWVAPALAQRVSPDHKVQARVLEMAPGQRTGGGALQHSHSLLRLAAASLTAVQQLRSRTEALEMSRARSLCQQRRRAMRGSRRRARAAPSRPGFMH